VRLIVDPPESRVDSLPTVRLDGVDTTADVTLIVETTDAAGHAWRSRTAFDCEDKSERWWAMEFVSEEVAPVNFVAPPDRLEYRLTAKAGARSTSAIVWRRWGASKPPQTIDGPGFRLTTLAAEGGGAKCAVLLIPGSTGAAPLVPRAALLAAHGHRVGVLSYMAEPGLPDSLREIPLEALKAGFLEFASQSQADGERIVVYAVSVGTGGILAALAAFPELEPAALVAVAPTHVTWQGLADSGPPPKTSSWTLAGEPLDWAPMHGERILPEVLRQAIARRFRRHPVPGALHMLPAYEAGLRDEKAVAAAALAVEQIRCPLLLISGDDDQMWPSGEMADAIITRRGRADDRHLHFAAAGHFIGPPFTPTTVSWNDSLYSGGSAAGIAAAQAESWRAVLDLLERAAG
jgi:pimeloyl-ACP methyl ester carboxylesterase